MSVAVCTPTTNRRWAYEFSKACFDQQDYPRQLLKWIVVDNSSDPNQDWSIADADIYIQIKGEKTVAQLRNECLAAALETDAKYIVFWDDDDYYPPKRISSGVKALEDNPNADIAASSKMYLLLTRENVLMSTGPFHDKHGTAASYTIRRDYAEKHTFDPCKKKGEEVTFTKGWTANMVQVDAEDVIVVMGHGRNTVDKSDLLANPQKYNARIENRDNGKQVFRTKWNLSNEMWQVFRKTFLAP